MLLTVAAVALVVWAVVRLLDQRHLRGSSRDLRKPKQPPPRVTGPDDDPDFLRDLDIDQRRRRAQEEGPPGDSST